MHKIFSTISRNLVFFISASMLFGFLYGSVFPTDFLKLLVVPAAFFVVYPMMVGLKIERIFKGYDFKLQLSTQLINFCIIPFVSFGIGLIFFRDNPHLLLGMLLLGILPTGGGTIAWVGILKGNVESAIKMAVIGPLIGVILAPFYIKFLIGPALDVELLAVIKQIVIIVILPMIFGVLTRKILLKSGGRERIFSLFPSFSTIGMICIVFIAMALKAKYVIQNPVMFLYISLPLILFYLFNLVMTTIVGRLYFNRSSAITLIYCVSMRNLSISLAIAMSLFAGVESDAVLVISVAYLIQIQSAAWYKKVSDIVFMGRKSLKPLLSER